MKCSIHPTTHQAAFRGLHDYTTRFWPAGAGIPIRYWPAGTTEVSWNEQLRRSQTSKSYFKGQGSNTAQSTTHNKHDNQTHSCDHQHCQIQSSSSLQCVSNVEKSFAWNIDAETFVPAVLTKVPQPKTRKKRKSKMRRGAGAPAEVVSMESVPSLISIGPSQS